MMTTYDVVFALAGDIRWNSRALKQLRLLDKIGCEVMAIGIGATDEVFTLGDAVTVRIMQRPAGGGPRFFWKVHKMMKNTLSNFAAKIYHASDLYTLPALAADTRVHGAKLVYDARELYPHVASTKGRPLVRFFWQQLESRFVNRVDAFFTVSERISTHLAKQYDIDPPLVLYNVPEYKKVGSSNLLRDELRISEECTVVLHQGNMQKDRGCFLLLQAVNDVHNAHLIFLGGGPLKRKLQHHVQALNLEGRVSFLEPVPPEKLLEYTASADIGVTLLEDSCLNHRYALPNKLFEYLMAGIPVIASDLPEIAGVIGQHQVGKLVSLSKPGMLSETIQSMVNHPESLSDMRRNIPSVFETFSWEEASEVFTRVYQQLLLKRS